MVVRFTRRELDVMSVLWKLGEASVREVLERLDDDLAYTSVLSQLQLLERKGHVDHRREGRSYRYRALTGPEAAGATAIDRVLDTLYRNSPIRLFAQLVEHEDVLPEDLEAMRRLIDERLSGAGKDTGNEDADEEGQ